MSGQIRIQNVRRCLALTLDGTRLATASEKGTILRVFDTLTGKLLQVSRPLTVIPIP